MISVKDVYEMKDRPPDDPVDALRLWAEENDLYFIEDVFLDNDDPNSSVDAAVYQFQTDYMEGSSPSAWVVDDGLWIYAHDGKPEQKIDPEEIFSWEHDESGYLVKR